ncbi:MAG: hypothetical protein P8Y97_12045 [Candidatus Lokiarchaeota archaeon]
MDPKGNKKVEKFDPKGQFIQDYMKFISKEEGFDYEDLFKNYRETPYFLEFNDLIKEFNEAEDKLVIENKIRAFEYRMKYKYTIYNIPICKEDDYNLFISDLETLIEEGLKKDLNRTLELIYNFIIRIIPTINKDRRLPSDKMVSALTKEKFEEWVKDRIYELKGQPIENIPYIIRKELRNFNLPFWIEQKELKSKILADITVLEQDVDAVVNNVEGYYEAFRLVCGILLGLFDLREDNFDDKLERSYFGKKFNTDAGLYTNRKGKKISLKAYIQKYGCQGFRDFFDWLMTSVKPIRLTGAHHQKLIEQDKLLEGKYKVMYGTNIQETPIGFLNACSIGVSSFITLAFWVSCYFFLNNV